MLTDQEFREAFVALDRAPAAADVAAVVQAAGPAPRRRGRAVAPLTATAVVAAIAVAVVALRPPDDEREVPATAGSLLAQAAAAAKQQPAFTGYRYTETISRMRYPLRGPGIPFHVVEERRETWVDRDWRGREITGGARIVEGRPDPAYERALGPRNRPYAYGDAPKAFPDELPTEPAALRQAIITSLHTEDWQERPTDPVPKEDWVEYHVVRRTILLLERANTTPELRAGLWGVLAMAPGVEAAPDLHDPLGRPGEAITIPNPTAPSARGLTVIFDPATSALLFWSEEGPDGAAPSWERHTVLRSAHVAEIGRR